MKFLPRLLFGFLTLLPILLAGAARADLDAEVRNVLLNDLLKRAEVGIEIVRLGSTPQGTQLLLKHNANIPLVPASNLKLITTSAALDGLGADFRFHTVLVRHNNDLVLVGDGDPTFGDAELLKKFGWDVNTVFTNWAQGLRKQGITSFANVIVDDSVFEAKFAHPHWPIDQLQKRYSAEVAGLNLNANCVDFTVRTTGSGNVVEYATNPPTHYLNIRNTCVSGGDNAIWLSRVNNTNDVVLRGTCPVSTDVPVSVTVHDPTMFTGTALAETLVANGIAVTGTVSRDRTARAAFIAATAAPAAAPTQPSTRPAWQALAVHETPLPQVLARCNKDSMNLYAECLCKRLGFSTSQQSGSWENGTQAVGAFLKKVGVDETEFHLDDGCGLSKENNISPSAIVNVLAYNFYGKNRDVFMASLSVAGSDGTLEHRFVNGDLRGRVFGKSGYVNGVSSLSGYLRGKDDQWYAFAILMNDVPAGGNSAAKSLQEAVVRAIEGK